MKLLTISAATQSINNLFYCNAFIWSSAMVSIRGGRIALPTRLVHRTPAFQCRSESLVLSYISTFGRRKSIGYASRLSLHSLSFAKRLTINHYPSTSFALNDTHENDWSFTNDADPCESWKKVIPNCRVHHWFTLSLPEGLCTGFTTELCPSLQTLPVNSHIQQHASYLDLENSTSYLPLLHDEEYHWGQTNIASDTARTSFYLGRIALRSSLGEMLLHSSASQDSDTKELFFKSAVWKSIQANPIRKDAYGRPVLPDAIAGSISHKGEFAVGLSRLRNNDSSSFIIENRGVMSELKAESINVKWNEECPVDPEHNNDNYNDGSNIAASSSYSVVGIGIDLERIDGERGDRIRRKVLTESEQRELGGLEDIGISKGEEVVLRFSLKESVYKALYPINCEYIGFHEAEIHPLADGTAQVRLMFLKDGIRGDHSHRTVVRSASWRRIRNNFFLTSALVVLGPDQK